MPFNEPFRKIVLTLHILFSIGWLASVVGFLALAIVGYRTPDLEIAKAMYIAMEVIGYALILPACFVALATGIIQALGTKWGLFRFYWIVAKLIITILATVLLLVHLQPIELMADAVTRTTFQLESLKDVRMQLIVDAALGIFALLLATILSVYKPWGLIKTAAHDTEARNKLMKRVALIAGIALLAFVVVKHLISGGMHHGQ